MLIDHQPLSFYVNLLRDGHTFSLTKHSDASLYCMQGRDGGDCNGCDYTPELRQGLLQSLKVYDQHYFRGIQRLTDRDNEAMDDLVKREVTQSVYMWNDTGIFASQFLDGGLYPLIEQLRKMRVVVVSNKRMRAVVNILPCKFIEVPESNALNDRDKVFRCIQSFEPAVFMFSCGMAASVFVSELHDKVENCWLIDFGHIWEALLGYKPRHYLKDLTQDHIDRNLRP